MYCKRPLSIPGTRLPGFEYSSDIKNLKNEVEYSICTDGLLERKGRTPILSVPMTFDIETTTLPANSKYNKNDFLLAFPYLYQIYICDHVYMFRDRTEIKLFFLELEDICLELNIKIICYVHNLSFEYQFMKSILNIAYEKVFLVKNRKVAKFELESNTIIFRDSYLLSNMSLAKFCENYCAEEYQKDKELIDYEIPRFPWTELSNEIIYYSGMDVIGLYNAIISIMQREGDDLLSIPMTNTGYVRRSYKQACLGKTKHKSADRKNSKEEYEKGIEYRKKYLYKSKLNLDQYNLLTRAFRGGNTHANRYKAGRIILDVGSYDFSSSYPAVMICSDQYPLGKLNDCTQALQSESDIEFYIKNYWVIMECIFEDTELRDPIRTPVPYIPKSKMICSKYDGVYDNGRLIEQKTPFSFSFLGCEYHIIRNQYKGKMKIVKAYYCIKGYLPLEIRQECYSWFKKKTELKNVGGMEYEYMKSKNRVNSSFGMMVERIIRDVQDINSKGEVTLRKPTEEEQEEQLEKYYSPRASKFLCYQWGVSVTALARVRLQELIDMIVEHSGSAVIGSDFIYADTDSVKLEHWKEYRELLIDYNNKWIDYAEKSGVPFTATTVKGEKQILGYTDFDGHYDRFITLGAKKYAYESDGHLAITVAGVPKKLGGSLLGKLENFKPGMIFNVGADGTLEDRQLWKKRLMYNDEANFDLKIDGHTLHIGTYIAMERTSYELSITEEYNDLITSSQDQEIFEQDDIWC